MKKIIILLLLFSSSMYAQKTRNFPRRYFGQKELLIQKYWNLFKLWAAAIFIQFLNHDREQTSLDKYDYATLKKVGTIISGNDLEGIKYFDDYTFSKDESKIILGIDLEKILSSFLDWKNIIFMI